MKICSKCRENKESKFFYKDLSKKDQLSSYCKNCRKLTTKINTQKNKQFYKEYKREYYQKNKEKIDKQNKLNQIKNKEKYQLTKKQWYIKNRERYLLNKRNYKKNRKRIDPLYKLKENLRNRLYYALKAKKWSKNTHFNNYIGCSQIFLLEYIESKFQSGMTWENYGKWHIDHIIPLSLAKTPEQMYKLSHYTNLQPLWIEDHKQKTFYKDIKEILHARY